MLGSDREVRGRIHRGWSQMNMDTFGRKAMIIINFGLLALSIGATVLGLTFLWQGQVGFWDDYRGQPMNSVAALILALVGIVSSSAMLLKLITEPRWRGWQARTSVPSKRPELSEEWPLPRRRNARPDRTKS